MAGWTDAVIVSLIAIGAVALVGVLGYLADKSGEEKSGEPEHEALEKSHTTRNG